MHIDTTHIFRFILKTMLIILSPAKTLDFTAWQLPVKTQPPALLKHSEVLVKQLRTYSPAKLKQLMGISDALAALNHDRFQKFSIPFTEHNAKPALLAFKGDVYTAIKHEQYDKAAFTHAANHVRILSGLYGLLKPSDLIQPYRLEMGTKLPVKKQENLYAFWGDTLTHQLNTMLIKHASPVLVNLASNEYSKAVQFPKIKGRVLTIHFKEQREGALKTIGLLAKRARGMMTHFAITNRITDSEALRTFNEDGYRFTPTLTKESNNHTQWVFVRNT